MQILGAGASSHTDSGTHLLFSFIAAKQACACNVARAPDSRESENLDVFLYVTS